TALMEIIDAKLRSAGWKFIEPEGSILYAHKAGVIAQSGISIHVPEEHLAEWGPAIAALRDALKSEGIPATTFSDTAEGEKDMKRDRVHVLIGSKPLD
ncbi:MAG TPA: hypothetical protein VE957_07235, partial [Terriglobales bacterium]|nr:hypothetical protein [Terriglobales bacterium]